jgi:hypothetical protein
MSSGEKSRIHRSCKTRSGCYEETLSDNAKRVSGELREWDPYGIYGLSAESSAQWPPPAEGMTTAWLERTDAYVDMQRDETVCLVEVLRTARR